MSDTSSMPAMWAEPGDPEPAVTGVTRPYIRYRLDVIASTVADVVWWAGGWLFDRAIAGWDVTAHLAEHTEARALDILGVKSSALEPGFESSESFKAMRALAVAAEMATGDTVIHDAINAALARGDTEIILWGAESSPKLHRRLTATHHHLSAAARAYKGAALRVADLGGPQCDRTEEFRSTAQLVPYEHLDLTPLHGCGCQDLMRTRR